MFFFFHVLKSSLVNHRYATLKTQEELLEWNGEYAKDNAKIIHASERCAGGI